MDRSEFTLLLQKALVGALSDFRRQLPEESPYALAVIPGQCGNYLDYAIATEEGVRRVASEYAVKGYRYRPRWEWEEFDNLERLTTWLRWANPDDGWHFGDFPDRYGVAPTLAALVKAGAFGEDAEELEEFCTDMITGLQSDPDWLVGTAGRVVAGVTYGCDPMDFLRTATRANRFGLVQELWSEYWRGEELSHSISRPGH